MLPVHQVSTAQEQGWGSTKNGELLRAAETAGFDALLTADQNIRYQQNLAGRKLAIVVLTGTTKWSRVRVHLQRMAAVVEAATPGSYTEVDIPFRAQGE